MTRKGRNSRTSYSSMQYARMRQKRMRVILLASAVALVIVLGVVSGVLISRRMSDIRLENEVNAHADTFQEGVMVEGVALTGYSREEAQALLDERYEASLSANIELVFEDKSWHFTPRDMGAAIDTAAQIEAAWQYGRVGTMLERQKEIRALQEEPVNLDVTLTYDRASLENLVAGIKSEIDKEPVSATMSIVEIGKFAYTDSYTGWDLDAGALVDQLEGMIREGKSGRVEIKPAVVEPEVSREQLEHSTLLLGECYTTLATSSASRTANVNLALSYFNFLQIEPGKKVSFNKVVGKRTEENGFNKAPEYAGTTIQTGIGGGVCQASTTVYGAVIRAGLEILERHKHTMTVGYVPGSQDAAVNDIDKDMRFRNTTENTLYVFAYVDSNKQLAVCKIFGQPIDPSVYIDIESVILQSDIGGGGISYMDDTEGTRVWYVDDPPVLYSEGKKGMRSEAYRVYRDAVTGEEIRRDRLSTDYYMPEDDTYLRGVHVR
ncbi:MAG: VanW family protein [Clostridia bacterium]|nr:VanW family protein [Clostridia bacterium]